MIRQLERGVVIDGRKTAPAKVKVRSSDKTKDKAIVEITIHEGRNRQVRKMFEAVGFEVQKLSREEYSFLNLRGLNAGERRELSHHEVKQLKTEARFGKNKSNFSYKIYFLIACFVKNMYNLNRKEIWYRQLYGFSYVGTEDSIYLNECK